MGAGSAVVMGYKTGGAFALDLLAAAFFVLLLFVFYSMAILNEFPRKEDECFLENVKPSD